MAGLALLHGPGKKSRHLDLEATAIAFVATTAVGLLLACSLACLDDGLFLVIVAAAVATNVVASGAARLMVAARPR